MKPAILILIIFLSFNLYAQTNELNTPKWVFSSPKSDQFIYSVGESKGIENKDDALERAWISALLRLGMTQFPELGKLRSESEETLHSASYNRKFVVQLESINWSGLVEEEKSGSPFVNFDEKSKTYTVYRLIKWSKKNLALSRASINQKKKNKIPISPEISRKAEEEVISEIQKINSLNKKIGNRTAFLAKILNRAKCGVSVDDLANILGSPDRTETCEYFWGTFQVWTCNGQVKSITPNNGNGRRRELCKGS